MGLVMMLRQLGNLWKQDCEDNVKDSQDYSEIVEAAAIHCSVFSTDIWRHLRCPARNLLPLTLQLCSIYWSYIEIMEKKMETTIIEYGTITGFSRKCQVYEWSNHFG